MLIKEIIKYKRLDTGRMKAPGFKRKKRIMSFRESLEISPLIAEVKKASPSLGDISPALDPVGQALSYQNGGAGAVSVLTDKKYFKGSMDDLRDVASVAAIPVLCKDFIVSEVQLEWAYCSGADAILLIPCLLDEKELNTLTEKAKSLSLEILFEIHSEDELQAIMKFDPRVVGVNSRDFNTFECDQKKAVRILETINGSLLKVAESGISEIEDIEIYKQAGADAFLVGTALVKSGNPEEMVRKFTEAGRGSVCKGMWS